MALTAYTIEHAPSPRDKDRFKLNLNCSEDDVKAIVKKLSSISSRHFPSSDQGYNWSIFLYNINDSLKEKLSLELDKAVGTKNPASEPSAASSASETSEDTGFVSTKLIPEYTFDSFVVGASTRFTYAACKSVAENPGKNYNPLFIYGGVGLGKTHLMHSIGNYVKNKFSNFSIAYITTNEFERSVVEAIQSGNLSSMREIYKKIDLLLIDDIQFLERSESTQEEFFHIFNDMYDLGKQIIITSDKPPKKLVTLEDRLKSRFEWGLTTDIKAPNYETRVAILNKKADKLGLKIESSINNYIAENLTSNIRELEGIVNRIFAYQQLSDEGITLEFIKDIVGNLLPSEETEEEETKKSLSQTESSNLAQEQYPPPPPPPTPPPMPGQQYSNQAQFQNSNICNVCRSPLTFIPQYQKWYCNRCGAYQEQTYPPYIPPMPSQIPAQPYMPPNIAPNPVKNCGTCHMPMRYINDYNKFYCDNCKAYDTASTPAADVVKPEPAAVVKKAKIKIKKESAQIKETAESEAVVNFEERIIGDKRSNIREIKTGYFLPEGMGESFSNSIDKLSKLATQKKFNFYITPQFTHYYASDLNINYDKMAHMAKTNEIDIALCLEPVDTTAKTDVFRKSILEAMDKVAIPFELIPNSDMKESDALNFMLDIAICARKK